MPQTKEEVPTIHIIHSIKILMYFDDHLPPHFHAEYNEYEVLIEIQNLETHEGYMPNKQHKRIITWAKKHQDFLMQKWNEFNPNT